MSTENKQTAKSDIGDINQNVYEFLREDGERPDLTRESDPLIALNGSVMNLPLRKLFWGYTIYPNPKIDISKADIKGYSLLQKCYDPKTGILTLDKVQYKLTLFDPASGQFFKIHHVRLSLAAWFDDDEFTDADKKKFGELIYNAKNINQKTIDLIVQEIKEKQEKENPVIAPIKEEDIERPETYDEYRDGELEDGFQEFRNGRISLFYHPIKPESIVRINDKKGLTYTELEIKLVRLDPENDKISYFDYMDGDTKYTMTLNEEDQTTNIELYVEPKDQQEEEQTQEEGSAADGAENEENPANENPAADSDEKPKNNPPSTDQGNKE